MNTKQMSYGLISIFVAFALLVAFQTNSPPSLPSDLEEFLSQYEQSFNGCDLSAFEELLAEDVSGFGVRGALATGSVSSLESLASQCNGGIRFDLEFRVIDYSGYESAAMLVLDIGGSIIDRHGEGIPVRLRSSLFLTRDSSTGEYRLRHSHMSGQNN